MAPQIPQRPHILLLMSDQHRYDVAGFAGNDVVRTPVLDQLARTGVVFDNAYSPSPICVPARQCIASGQLPSTCGCRDWGDDLPPGYRTFAREFSEHAYATVACGKLHHDGLDQNQGWRLRIGWDNPIANKYIPNFRWNDYKPYESPHQWWPWAKEIQRAGIGVSPHLKRDEMAVWGACEFIEDQFNSPFYDKESRQPVLLKVSLRFPHYPFLTTDEAFNYYLNRVPCFLDEEVFDHPVLGRDPVIVGEDVTEREVRRATAAYYGMVEATDAMFGRVLDKLRQVGQDPDDWLIIYTSDHSEMLGEHGVWMKYKFFEGSVRAPLIVRFPRRFEGGRRVAQNVNLCDLYATLCEAAGLPVPAGLDSRSLWPLLEGRSECWDDESISQIGNHVMIKRGALKYQNYAVEGPGQEILFDLEEDPGETSDRSADPAYRQAMEQFRRRLAAYRGAARPSESEAAPAAAA